MIKRSIWLLRLRKIVLIVVTLLFWLGCLRVLYADVSGKSAGEKLNQTGIVLFLLLVHLLMIQLLTPYLQMLLIKGVSYLFRFAGYASIIAKWQLLFQQTYLKTLQSALTMGITLISGFLLYVQNTYIGNAVQARLETLFSFLAYLSAPILLIVVSLLSTIILSSYRDQKDLKQLRVLGVSNRQFIMIRLCEGLMQIVVVLMVSTLFNGLSLLAVSHGVAILGLHMRVLTGLWLPMLVILPTFFVFYLGIKASLLVRSGK